MVLPNLHCDEPHHRHLYWAIRIDHILQSSILPSHFLHHSPYTRSCGVAIYGTCSAPCRALCCHPHYPTGKPLTQHVQRTSVHTLYSRNTARHPMAQRHCQARGGSVDLVGLCWDIFIHAVPLVLCSATAPRLSSCLHLTDATLLDETCVRALQVESCRYRPHLQETSYKLHAHSLSIVGWCVPL